LIAQGKGKGHPHFALALMHQFGVGLGAGAAPQGPGDGIQQGRFACAVFAGEHGHVNAGEIQRDGIFIGEEIGEFKPNRNHR
jgi:hypothetical protein